MKKVVKCLLLVLVVMFVGAQLVYAGPIQRPVEGPGTTSNGEVTIQGPIELPMRSNSGPIELPMRGKSVENGANNHGDVGAAEGPIELPMR